MANNFYEQAERGLFICPKTKQRLRLSKDKASLDSDNGQSYPVFNGVPIFLQDVDHEFFSNPAMVSEYNRKDSLLRKIYSKVKRFLYYDFRNQNCTELLRKFDQFSEDAVLLGIGGGPSRAHKNLTNLNISNFPNVEVVADAHYLPYADNSVDGVVIEAVIEHLYNPLAAIKEIFRVLKPGGIVLSITPFLQPYHGYPHHYQNLTLTGHKYYYSSNGFVVEDSGTAIGPTFALIILNSKYFLHYFPKGINILLGSLYIGFSMLFLKPLDFFINRSQKAHLICSATYVFAKKPK